MFSNLEYGWVRVDIGELRVLLSYMTYLPRNWIDQAIFGLENKLPIVVHGDQEPGRCLFTFTDKSCFAFFEDSFDRSMEDHENEYYILPMGKMEFCQKLHKGISENLDEWTLWLSGKYLSKGQKYPYKDPNFIQDKNELIEKLHRLDELIKTNDKKGSCKHD